MNKIHRIDGLYHCPFEIRLCSGKERAMAVSAVWRLVYFLAPCPSEPKEQTAAPRRDALCPSTKIQKQAAFGIRIPSGWRQVPPFNFLNSVNSVEYPFCVNVLFGRMLDNELPSPAWKRLSQLKVSPTVARVWDDCRMDGYALFTAHCPANASSCKW